MTVKIFRSTLAVALAVLLGSVSILAGVAYRSFQNLQFNQLLDELSLAAAGTQSQGLEYLTQVESQRFRLTWIAQDGTVLYDTQADETQMENHSTRQEILEAFQTGYGTAQRYSDTLTQKTIYAAQRLRDGSVLRLSTSSATSAWLLLEMAPSLLTILATAVALSAWLSHRIAKRIVDPLNRLDLEHPLQNESYPELEPMLRRLSQQHLQIGRQLQELRRKTEEFQHITENMSEGLVLLDGRGLILSINSAACQLFDGSPQAVGKDFMTLDQTPEMRAAVDRAYARGAAQFQSQRKGRIYQISLDRILSDGTAIGVVILSFDITQQAQAQQSRREFSANVSHELKTPLQAILGSAELMEQGIVKTQDMPRFAGLIRKDARRLLTLVEDIIGLSQLDEGVSLAKENVALSSILRDTAELLAPAARQRQITIQISCEDCTVFAVPRLVSQILFNLCDNAIKYNNPGGRVVLRCRKEASGTVLSVEDTGIGIAPEHQDRVFERFYRVDKSHSRQSGGTGLGLSIVKHASQLCGASLDLESTPGIGTAVTLFFPK